MVVLHHPLISVITPAFNAAETIKETLRSVREMADCLSRQGASVQHLIMDGGSSDGTQELVVAHQQLLSSKQQHGYNCCLYSSPDEGIYAAMNEGLSMADGFFSHILNADDFILNSKRYAASILNMLYSDYSILLSSILYFRRPGFRQGPQWRLTAKPSDSLAWKHALLKGLHFPHPGFIAKTDLYREQGFDLQYKFSADYKLMQSLLLRDDLQDKINISIEPLVAMAKGGVTGTWRGIWLGASEIRAINQELGISGSLLRRYSGKLAMRFIG